MRRVKRYLKSFMFYFGAFALTLTLVAGSKVALFFINRKPADEPIHSEDDVTEDNTLTKVINKIMETDNAKVGLSLKVSPQNLENPIDVNADVYVDLQDSKNGSEFSFDKAKLSVSGVVKCFNENISFDISYLNNYIYANLAGMNFKLSTSNVMQDISKILNFTILDKIGVKVTLPDMSNMSFDPSMLTSLASGMIEQETEQGRELSIDLFGYGTLVIATDKEYLPQSMYIKDVNLNGTQIIANLDTNFKADKEELKEPENKDELTDVSTLTNILESVDKIAENGKVSGILALDIYNHNFNVEYSLDFRDTNDIKLYAKTKLGDDFIKVNFSQNKVFVTFKDCKYYYNTNDFDLNKIVDAIKFYLNKFNIEIPEFNFKDILNNIDLKSILNILSNVNNIKVSENGITYEKPDYAFSLNIKDGEIDNIKANYKEDVIFVLTVNQEIEELALNEDEYKNIKDETIVSKIIDGILYDKNIAFEISANYNNEKINAVLNIDLKNDLKIQLKTNIFDTNFEINYINNDIYVEFGNILRAKGTLKEISDFINQFESLKQDNNIFKDFDYNKVTDMYRDILDFINSNNISIDFSKSNDSIDGIKANVKDISLKLNVKDFEEIKYEPKGEYQNITEIANYIQKLTNKINEIQPIFEINAIYKNYEINGQIKYINNELEGKFATIILEKELNIFIKNKTIFIDFDGFKLKCGFENAKEMYDYIMTFAKDDIENLVGKIEMPNISIKDVLSELKVNIINNIAKIKYNDVTLTFDNDLFNLSVAYNDISANIKLSQNFDVDVNESEFIDLYEFKDLSKALYNTLKNLCISGNATAHIKLFGELNTLNVNYKVGFVDNTLIGFINTNFKGLNINIYIENNDIYFDVIGIKLHINTDEIQDIVKWINKTFNTDINIETNETLYDKIKDMHFDFVKSVKTINGKTYVEFKDNFNINVVFDDYVRQVEFIQNENGAILECTNFEKFDLSNLNKQEYKSYTSYTTLIENVYNQIMQKQFNLNVGVNKYKGSKQIKNINCDVNLDLSSLLSAYVNVSGLDEQITAHYSNKALYFCYGGETGLKIKIREDAIQEILSILCSAFNIDVSSIPLLNDFLTKENIDTGNLSEILPEFDMSNPLALLEYVETINYTDTDLTIVLKGEKLGEYANGKDITIRICYNNNKLTNIEVNNLITNVETNEKLFANIVFNEFNGVKQVENTEKYIDLSDSKDLIRVFVNTSNLNDFHIVGGIKLNIDIGIKFDAATVGVDARIKKITTKTKEFDEETGEITEKETIGWDGIIEINNYPIITGVNNSNSNGVALLSRKRVITIYFHEGNIYLSTVDEKSGACKEFSRMTKIEPSYLFENIKYYMQYLLGFTDSIQNKINEAIDKSQAYEGKTDYGNIVKEYTHSNNKHTVVVNLAELAHNADIGTLSLIIETSNQMTSDGKDYFKRLDMDLQVLDGMISLKTNSSSNQSDNESLFLVDIGQSVDISKATKFIDYYDNVYGFGLNGEYEKEGTGSWKQVNRDERKIYFIDNGQTILTQTGVIASKIDFPNMEDRVLDDNITKVTYTFAGWYTDDNYTNKFIQDTFPNSNITLYAKWEIKEQKKYTKINFVTNDERVDVNSIIGFVGENLSLPNLSNLEDQIDENTSKLKVFLGWQTADGKDYTETTFQDGEITLYAKWEEIVTKTYSLTIYHNNEIVYSGKVKADEEFNIKSLDIYENSTKVYSSQNFDENNLVSSFVVSQNTVWYIRNAYYVTVVSNYTTLNGNPYFDKQTLYEGSTLALPQYSNFEENKGSYTVEYKFLGYKLEGNNELITSASVLTVAGDNKYIAVWDVKEYCIVTFDTNAWTKPGWWVSSGSKKSVSSVSNTNNTNQVKIERNTDLVFSNYVATAVYSYGGPKYNFKTVAWGDSVQNLYDGKYTGAATLKITSNITLKPIWVHA